MNDLVIFWVVNRLYGITEAKEQIRIWSITTTITWSVDFVQLIILKEFYYTRLKWVPNMPIKKIKK